MAGAPPRRYFDNAATSFPKPPSVAQAVQHCLVELGASPGRGAYRESIEAGRLIQRCRELICRLINGESPRHVIFTLNTTDALNLAIKGIVRYHQRRGEPVHIVTTWMDHNSILRPFRALEADGVRTTRVTCDPVTGLVSLDDLERSFEPDTRLVATIAGSNVTGTLQPVAEIGAICRERNLPFLVDAAQTLGHMPLDVREACIDLLAFPGHKGLLGPLGTGGLYIRPGMERRIEPLREGGTGSVSEQDIQPTALPDRYEPGSHNAPGIAGLAEGVKWILDQGVDNLWRHEQHLIELLLDGLLNLPGVTLLGPREASQRCGVFSINVDGLEPAELATVLEDEYGILARPGLHCAPLAHQTVSQGAATSSGAVRLSLGPFLTENDVRYAIDSLGAIVRTLAASS